LAPVAYYNCYKAITVSLLLWQLVPRQRPSIIKGCIRCSSKLGCRCFILIGKGCLDPFFTISLSSSIHIKQSLAGRWAKDHGQAMPLPLTATVGAPNPKQGDVFGSTAINRDRRTSIRKATGAFMDGFKIALVNAGNTVISPVNGGSYLKFHLVLKSVRGIKFISFHRELGVDKISSLPVNILKASEWRAAILPPADTFKGRFGVRFICHDINAASLDVDFATQAEQQAWLAADLTDLPSAGALPMPASAISQGNPALSSLLIYSFVLAAWQNKSIKGWLAGILAGFFPFRAWQSSTGFILPPKSLNPLPAPSDDLDSSSVSSITTQTVDPLETAQVVETSAGLDKKHRIQVDFEEAIFGEQVPFILKSKPLPDKKAFWFRFTYTDLTIVKLVAHTKIFGFAKIKPVLYISELHGEGLLHFESERISMSLVSPCTCLACLTVDQLCEAAQDCG
jgi:hypothetical protein